MSMVILGGMALQWPIGRLSDRFDRRKVIIAVAFALAVVCGLISGLLHDTNVMLYLLGFAFGGLIFSIYSLSVAHTNDFMKEDDLISASSGLLFSFGLGAFLGPFTASELITVVGPRGLFIHIGLVATLLMIFGLIRAFARSPVPNAAQAMFVAVPETTRVAEGLDPRVDPAMARHLDTADAQSSDPS